MSIMLGELRAQTGSLPNLSNSKLYPFSIPHHSDPDIPIDFTQAALLAPLDGARDLMEGRDGGSISAIAGGNNKSFQPAIDPSSRRSVVIALRVAEPDSESVDGHFMNEDARNRVDSTLRSVAEAIRQEIASEKLTFAHLPHIKALNEFIHSKAPRGSLEFSSTVTATRDQYRSTQPISHFVSRFARRLRIMGGSSLAAGALVYIDTSSGPGLLSCMCRPEHAMMMATMARISGHYFLCIPLAAEGSGAHTKFEGSVLTAEDLCPDPDNSCFFICSGVSENIVVRGVRNVGRSRLRTFSLSASREEGIVSLAQETREDDVVLQTLTTKNDHAPVLPTGTIGYPQFRERIKDWLPPS